MNDTPAALDAPTTADPTLLTSPANWAGLDRGSLFGIAMAEPESAGDRRVMVCAASDRPTLSQGEHMPAWMDVAGANLSRLSSGLAPVLLDHYTPFEYLVGVVERAWKDDRCIYAILRIGPTARCTEVWEMIRSGVLRHVSIGYRAIIEKEADGSGARRVAYCLPYEISLCSIPADWSASIVAPKVPRRVVEMLANNAALATSAAGEPWREWASRIAPLLAAARPEEISEALQRAVEKEIAERAARASAGVLESYGALPAAAD